MIKNVGEKIDIYCDPLTRTKLEGRATLIQMTYRDDVDGLNRWLVRFDGDTETYERTVHADQTDQESSVQS